MKLWNALIKTAGGRLARVEFESPSHWRGDAAAQAKSAYGASEVVSIDPATIPVKDAPSAPRPNISTAALVSTSFLDHAVGWLVIVPIVAICMALPIIPIAAAVGYAVWFTVKLAKTGPWN